MSEPRYTKEAQTTLERLEKWATAQCAYMVERTSDVMGPPSEIVVAARAFLAATEKGGDCSAHGPDAGKGLAVAREVSTTPATEKESAEPVKPQERNVNKVLEAVSEYIFRFKEWGHDAGKFRELRDAYMEYTAPKPEPQERSAEEILVGLLADDMGFDTESRGFNEIREALTKVRALRAKLDSSHAANAAVSEELSLVKAERDELAARVERAKAEWNRHLCYCQKCSDDVGARMFRAISGEKP